MLVDVDVEIYSVWIRKKNWFDGGARGKSITVYDLEGMNICNSPWQSLVWYIKLWITEINFISGTRGLGDHQS